VEVAKNLLRVDCLVAVKACFGGGEFCVRRKLLVDLATVGLPVTPVFFIPFDFGKT